MMMVVGGGILPLIQQFISDSAGYMNSYWLIIAMLAYLLFYGLVGCKNVNKDILTRFEALLRDYFTSDKPQRFGLPSVAWCADRLHLSPNYFGDLIKKETGKSAQEYVQLTTIDRAKELLTEGSRSVSEIAYELGFKYPHHLSRLFKKVVGYTPNEYKTLPA